MLLVPIISVVWMPSITVVEGLIVSMAMTNLKLLNTFLELFELKLLIFPQITTNLNSEFLNPLKCCPKVSVLICT